MKGPCLQGNQSPCGLYIRAGLILLDPLTNGRHPFACSAPTSLGESVATLVPQFTRLPDDCDGTRCAFLFGNNFGGVRSGYVFWNSCLSGPRIRSVFSTADRNI